MNQTLRYMSTIHSPFPSRLITFNLASVPTAFHWFFTTLHQVM